MPLRTLLTRVVLRAIIPIMSLKDRHTQQYLIAAVIMVPIVIALYFFTRMTQNQDIGVYSSTSKGVHQLIVVKRDGSYQRFKRTLSDGSLSVERGKWAASSSDPNKNVLPPGAKPERFIQLTGNGDMPRFMSKEMFRSPDAKTRQTLEEWRNAVGE